MMSRSPGRYQPVYRPAQSFSCRPTGGADALIRSEARVRFPCPIAFGPVGAEKYVRAGQAACWYLRSGPPSYATVKCRLPTYGADAWRQRLAALCAHHVGLGPATLLLYDVTTLYFETDTGDGFREPGFSKKRRRRPL